jgi:hypothetical protein
LSDPGKRWLSKIRTRAELDDMKIVLTKIITWIDEAEPVGSTYSEPGPPPKKVESTLRDQWRPREPDEGTPSQGPRMASDSQIALIRKLNGTPHPGMTMKEAHQAIQSLMPKGQTRY